MDLRRPAPHWLILAGALAALLLTLALGPSLARAPQPAPPAVTVSSTGTAPAALASPSPAPVASPTPAPQIAASAATGSLTITFGLSGQVPAHADEALLWYDTVAGHAVRRVPLDGAPAIGVSVTITPTQEGLTLTEPLDGGLDYWWAVRDRNGTAIRRSGSVALPGPLAALARTAPITAPAEIAWVERQTQHFRLYVPPATAAARDLDALSQTAEASYNQAAALIAPTEPVSIPVYLVPRIFWQGGVAYGQKGPLVISYLDRSYLGVPAWSYFVHEVTHALSDYVLPAQAEVGGVLGEGLAVYAAGGHYGLEPIDAWAAALAASDRYIPLCRLRYDFYGAQHEIAYQEAASFAGYLIRGYGLDAFKQIYKAQRPPPGDRQPSVEEFCAADDQRSVPPTGKTAGALEHDWLAYLKTIAPTGEQRRSWELTIRFFDTMRRYQEKLDPPARELPPAPKTWDRATAAKFLNAATGRRSAVLETMLGAAEDANRSGDLDHAAALLDEIERSLDASGAPAGPLARDYDAIAGLLDQQARALRLGDRDALDRTLATAGLASRLPFTTGDLLHDLRYTPVELDVRDDTAQGVVQVSGASLAGRRLDLALYRARFARLGGRWLMTGWDGARPAIEPPPG